MTNDSTGTPKPTLSVTDAIGVTVGIVVGAGIFATPSLVAGNSGSTSTALFAWMLGGAISLIGALVYAELAAAFPHPGGDYHFLMRAYGPRVSFLFGWARMTVIQTGSIAFLAFVFGDYASQVVSLGPESPILYAVLVVVALTGLNILGVRQGVWTQNILTAMEVLGVLLVIVVGLSVPPAAAAPTASAASSNFGLAMVFVLLTYGGWNEAAYLSTELRDVKRNMLKALVASLAIVTFLYLTVNWVYLRALGLAGAGQSGQIAADVMRLAFGDPGARFIGVLVAIASLTSANASILTGARSSYALGRDVPAFSSLGRWSSRGETPVRALIVQGVITLALVFLGAATRGSSINESALRTIIDYTAPVFWLFFLMTGVALFVLRLREPAAERPFRVPLYPVTPLLFCLAAAYLLYSSLDYVRIGAVAGLAVLAAGVVVMFLVRPSARN
jgi:amino acid transporter